MRSALQGNFLGKWVQKLVEWLPSLSGGKENAAIKKPQCFRLQLLLRLSELENDTGKKFLRNLENGDTVCYKSDCGNSPEAFHGETKQRVWNEQREFLGNY